MEIISESPYCKVQFHSQKSILYIIWREDLQDFSEDKLKEEIIHHAEIIKAKRPKFCVSDDRKRNFVFSIETQNWVSAIYKEAAEQVNFKKLAILLPSDLIKRLSTEQVVEEVGRPSYEIKLFDSDKKAHRWLDQPNK